MARKIVFHGTSLFRAVSGAFAGVVRLTNHDLADHDRSGLSRCKLTPLGQSGRTVLFEDMAAVEVTVEVKVVVDRGVRGGKFLQGFDVPELRHSTLSSPERLM